MGWDITGLGSLFDFGSKLIDKVLPDPAQKAQALLQLEQLHQTGELAQLAAVQAVDVAQSKVNEVEAASASVFVSGWRPAVGWVCCLGFAYSFVLQPLLAWVSINMHGQVPPVLDSNVLMTLLTGILGISTQRTYEKMKGVAAK